MQALPFTLGAFALILVLSRLKVPLAAAIAVGALAVGAACRPTEPGAVLVTALAGVIDPRTIALALVTLFLLGLSMVMEQGGQFTAIVRLATLVVRRPSVAMAALPALVGLLPMPGGAVFSAPMVASAAGGQDKVPGAVLSAINYWFRHIWEHWWPLYPGVLLALALTHADYFTFLRYQMPLGAFMVLSGLVLFRGTHADLHLKSPPPPPGTKRQLLRAVSPILLILVIWMGASAAIGRGLAPHIPERWRSAGATYLPLILGLVGGLACSAHLSRLDRRTVLRCLFGRRALLMAVLVLAVMVFQYVLAAVKAAEGIAQELNAFRVPTVLVVPILPYIAGLVTGLAIGFVGTSFPIVLALVEAGPGPESILTWMVLAYGFGHLGQMSSPIHVCHVVSNQYFGTGFGPVYRRLVPALLVSALLVTGYFLLLRLV